MQDGISISIYTDGSCLWKTLEGGVGISIIIQKGIKIVQQNNYYKGFSNTTIGRMELMGILLALKTLNKTSLPIILFCDSKYAIQAANFYKQNFEEELFIKNKITNSDIILKILDEKTKFKHIKFKWIKGHNGNFQNENVDALADIGFKEDITTKIFDTGNIDDFLPFIKLKAE
jgi:ribonuclease HI